MGLNELKVYIMTACNPQVVTRGTEVFGTSMLASFCVLEVAQHMTHSRKQSSSDMFVLLKILCDLDERALWAERAATHTSHPLASGECNRY